MKCRLCKKGDETIEHVCNECEKTKEIMKPCVLEDVKKDSTVNDENANTQNECDRKTYKCAVKEGEL